MTTFIVRTAAGAPIYTSSERELALRFARLNRDVYPGLFVDSETVSVSTRRVWTDRKEQSRAA